VEVSERGSAREEEEILDSIVRDVIFDLDLTNAIERMKIFMDPEEPYFIIVAILRPPAPPIKLKEVADIYWKGEKIILSVHEETYMPSILGFLWKDYGRERVEQPERLSTIINTSKSEIDKISNFIVHDPSKVLFENLIDAFERITPEGFRIVKRHFSGEEMYFVASEDPIKKDWVKHADRLLTEIVEE
jgi:putative methanogenesis marker protein 17